MLYLGLETDLERRNPVYVIYKGSASNPQETGKGAGQAGQANGRSQARMWFQRSSCGR